MTTTDSPRRPRRNGGKLVLAALLLAALTGFFWWQQNGLQLQTVTIPSPRLPAPFDGLRIVHLSDLHGKQFGADSRTLVEQVASLQPDLIAITGDLIDRTEQLSGIPALAAALVELAPTYYVTGNHEWAVRQVNHLKQLLSQLGVRVLNNSFDIWEKEGATLAVAGVDDPNGPLGQKTGDELRQEIDADYTILLSHRDTVEEYSSWGYDLVLCGHGHGGILRIPLLDIGLLSTDRTFFPRYDGGLYEFGSGSYCFVSRGLGNNTTPIHAFRLFNRPDLPLLVLRTSHL